MTGARRRTAAPAPAPATRVVVRHVPPATTAAAAPPAASQGMPRQQSAQALLLDVNIHPKGTVADRLRVLDRDRAVVVAAAAEEEEAQTGHSPLMIALGNATADRRMGPGQAAPAGRTASPETAT